MPWVRLRCREVAGRIGWVGAERELGVVIEAVEIRIDEGRVGTGLIGVDKEEKWILEAVRETVPIGIGIEGAGAGGASTSSGAGASVGVAVLEQPATSMAARNKPIRLKKRGVCACMYI